MLVCVIPTLRTQQPKEIKVTYMHTQIQLHIYLFNLFNFCFLFCFFAFYLANIITDIRIHRHTYTQTYVHQNPYHRA